MRNLLVLILGCGLLSPAIAGCDRTPTGQTASTKPTDKREDVEMGSDLDLVGTTDFHFEFWEGAPVNGYSSVKISAAGDVEYIFNEDVYVTDSDGTQVRALQWKRVNLQIANEVVDRLRALLVEIEFAKMRGWYNDPSIMDGTTTRVLVQSGGKTKSMTATNTMPPELPKIRAFLRNSVLVSVDSKLATAELLPVDSPKLWPHLSK